MAIIQQVLFVLCALAAAVWFGRKVSEVRRNIRMGGELPAPDQVGKRLGNVALLALGQRKMFKRPVPALLHLAVYAGFIIINLEMLEIVLDGALGTHRLFVPLLGSWYTWLIGFFEILAVLVLLSCVVFFIRRNFLKVRRLNQQELEGWPKNDANLILITEIVLMSLFLIMNTADMRLQELGDPHYRQTGTFWITGHLTGMFSGLSAPALVTVERTAWWLHIIGVFLFLNYLPYSKHFHIILAFPAAFYTRLRPQGELKNMPAIQNEVLYMMQPELAPAQDGAAAQEPQRFGARDAMDLSRKHILEAYACTECGRCTAVCPANITGKKLSPRKIMMDTRDRVEEIGRNIRANKTFVDDGKSLVHDYISVEELRACTTCSACVEACPVGLEPLAIIYELRRYLVMEESNSPQEWNLIFSNMENNMAPWKFSPDERDKWAEELAAGA